MAQSRMVSVLSKQEKVEENLKEIEELVSTLLKTTRSKQKKTLGQRKEFGDVTIAALQEKCTNIDSILLKINILVSTCSANNTYVQHQLQLMSIRSLIGGCI